MKTDDFSTDVFTTTVSNGEPQHEGVVVRKNIGSCQVLSNGVSVTCELAPRLRKHLIYASQSTDRRHGAVLKVRNPDHSDPIAIGDRVCFTPISDGRGLVVEVLPRRNQLARQTAKPQPGAHAFEQVIAANVDQMIAVFAAAQPPPKWNMLDRYLVSAEAAGIDGVVCLTKADLAVDLAMDPTGGLEASIEQALAEYRQIGYRVIVTSAQTGSGIRELQDLLHRRRSVLVGKSGVGKTSLLNRLQPGLGLRVGEVSHATGKGRHTTAHLEMFALAGGGEIIDTPGVREFGLWLPDVEDLAEFFPEMRPRLGLCKFGLDCRHDEEPGCSIRAAVLAGEITPRRYHSYMKLASEVGER